MALVFPSSPTLGQTYQSGSSATYQWNGNFWTIVTPPTSVVVNAVSSSRAAVAGTSFALTSSLTEVAHVATVGLSGSYAANVLYFNTNITNTLGWWNNTTGRFTPQKAGWYQVNTSYDVYCGSNQETNMSYIFNGSQIISTGAIGMIKANLNYNIYFNGSTDYLQVMSFPATSQNRGQGTNTTRFQATYLGNW